MQGALDRLLLFLAKESQSVLGFMAVSPCELVVTIKAFEQKEMHTFLKENICI